MLSDIRDVDEPSFRRHWAERAWDRIQLAHIAALEEQLIEYAAESWRSMNIPPPTEVPILGAYRTGVAVVMVNPMGDWRSTRGDPQIPPTAWMPCPALPKT